MNDLLGIGQLSEGVSKLITVIKDWWIWSREPNRLKEIIKISKENSGHKLLSYESESLKIQFENNNLPLTEEYYEKQLLLSNRSQNIKKQMNVDKVVLKAIEALNKKENISENQVEEEWIANFFEHAKYATSDYMQKLWGKILSDEISNPNTYSIRALNTLRYLKKSDAEKFSKLCELILTNISGNFHIIFIDYNYLYENFKITGSDLKYLEELGLIHRSAFGEIPTPIVLSNNKTQAVFTYADQKILIYQGEKDLNKIGGLPDISYIYLSVLGKEFFKLVNSSFHEDYIKILNLLLCPIDNNKNYNHSLYIANMDALNLNSSNQYSFDMKKFTEIKKYFGIRP